MARATSPNWSSSSDGKAASGIGASDPNPLAATTIGSNLHHDIDPQACRKLRDASRHSTLSD